MSLNFALLVTGPAYGTQAASTAYRFALSLVEQDTACPTCSSIRRVCNANGLHTQPAMRPTWWRLWRLAGPAGIRIDVCVAAAMRRGVLDEQEAKGMGRSISTWSNHSVLSVGSGQLMKPVRPLIVSVQF